MSHHAPTSQGMGTPKRRQKKASRDFNVCNVTTYSVSANLLLNERIWAFLRGSEFKKNKYEVKILSFHFLPM